MTYSQPFSDRCLALLLLISLLLHGAGLLLLNRWSHGKSAVLSQERPLYVEMRDNLPPPPVFDTPPPAEVSPPRTTPAKRLGAHDQAPPREQAPAGNSPFDRLPSPAPQQTAPVPLTPPQPLSPAVTESGRLPTSDQTAATQPPPSRRQLLASADQAAERVAEDWAKKIRDEVERGDAVWYDTEKDLLISFFDRFRRGIYNVWDYPAAAAAQGAAGTCLLRITINRAGLAENVTVIQSSGHRLLDDEAVNAVEKASASFGYLPVSYPRDRLIFYAYFHYLLGSRPTIGGRN